MDDSYDLLLRHTEIKALDVEWRAGLLGQAKHEHVPVAAADAHLSIPTGLFQKRSQVLSRF